MEGRAVIEGSWCVYCPAFNRCPAKVGLVREMVDAMTNGGALSSRPVDGAIVTADNAARVWRKLDAVESIAKRMREQIEKLAEQEPIDLGDGYELRLSEGEPKEKITQPSVVLALLGEWTDEVTAREAASTSKKAIATVVRGWARKVGEVPAVVEERVFKALRAANLLEDKVGDEKVREVRIRK